MSNTKLHPVAAKLHLVQGELNVFFKERKTCIEALVLALLSGEHAFVYGVPGTGKTYLAITLFEHFPDARRFEALLSKTLPTEAVLGPYDIPDLRTNGNFHRKVNGFLPTADLAMLDEIGKMSPTLGHNLLAILNERILHEVNGGRSSTPVPLSTAIGGSNELPTSESEDAAALWDRILIRIEVKSIQEMGNFIAMLTDDKPARGTEIAWADMLDVIKNVVPAVTLPTDVLEVIGQLKEKLRGMEITPSDRRWKHSIKLLKASAFMHGRTEVNTDDIEVLRHSLWETPTQISGVERATLTVSNPIAEAALALQEQAETIAQEIRDSKGLSIESKGKISSDLNSRLESVTGDLGRLRQKALSSGASVTKIEEVQQRVGGIKSSILEDLLGLDLSSLVNLRK
jgi:MoxR-like ATPase